MSKKGGLSLADLQKGAKSLHSVEAPSESKSSKQAEPSDEDVAAIKALENVYEKHNGNLDLIFEELQTDPTKAKKPHNRPKNAAEFANKFFHGFYSLVDSDEPSTEADAKSSHK
eukprot:gene14591-19592_t